MKVRLQRREPPAASVEPATSRSSRTRSRFARPAPDVVVRAESYMRRNRHIWMQTPRCAFSTPFGTGRPGQKNSSAGSWAAPRRWSPRPVRAVDRAVRQKLVQVSTPGAGSHRPRDGAGTGIAPTAAARPSRTDARLEFGQHRPEILLADGALGTTAPTRRRTPADGPARAPSRRCSARRPHRRRWNANTAAITPAGSSSGRRPAPCRGHRRAARATSMPGPQFGVGPARDTVGIGREGGCLAFAVARRHLAQESRQGQRAESRLGGQLRTRKRSKGPSLRPSGSSTSAVQRVTSTLAVLVGEAQPDLNERRTWVDSAHCTTSPSKYVTSPRPVRNRPWCAGPCRRAPTQ